jgi:hypothetical protein
MHFSRTFRDFALHKRQSPTFADPSGRIDALRKFLERICSKGVEPKPVSKFSGTVTASARRRFSTSPLQH